MPTLANDLVLFLMGLFGNQEAAQEFLADPERSLETAGLGGVCSADVDAALPVVLDYAPITVNASSFDRSYNTGGHGAATGGAGAVVVTPPPSGGGNGDHAHAVQQLHNVVNNYSYTSTVDDRDTITDQSINQNIWADGDVEQWFDNHAVVASGDRAVAAGDDVDMDDSNNIEDSYNTDNSNDSSTDDSFNTALDVDVDDSFNDNSDNSVDNSEETTTEVAVVDSFNPVDVEVEDSFTEDNSINTDVEVEDVGNTEINAEDDVNL